VPPGGPESSRLQVSDCSVGVQQRRRGLFYPVAHPHSTSRFENHRARSRYSPEIVDFAREGIYSLKGPADLKTLDRRAMTEEEKLLCMTHRDQGSDQTASIFERLNESELEAMFDIEGDQAKVKSWLKEGITWRVGDASDPGLVRALGGQDVVVANRFLCHMEPAAAERCLRNIADLVKPGGHLFVSGVDLDVRTKVAKELAWRPVPDLMKEIHQGDPSLATGWPVGWWGLEPFCENHADRRIRYASVFRIGITPSFKPDAPTSPSV